MTTMNTCYVYKWTHLPTMKWYVGSRTAKNSHPNDGYICSSRLVKPLILANQQDWLREVVDVGTADEMYALETEILQLFDAKNDSRSFNAHNNDGLPRNKHLAGKPSNAKGAKWSDEAKAKKAEQNRGVNNPRYGAVISTEQKEKQSKSMTGKPSHWKGKSNPQAAKNGKKSAAKLSATVTGRKMATREDGTRYWIYPQRESTNTTQ